MYIRLTPSLILFDEEVHLIKEPTLQNYISKILGIVEIFFAGDK